MQEYDIADINLEEIERKARKLRAEAVANSSKTMFRWVKSLFATRANRPHQTA